MLNGVVGWQVFMVAFFVVGYIDFIYEFKTNLDTEGTK